mmetsp:Transcript_22771/g.38749  ORF Transcript_22771/g.38749 Transcript_22771/m.38749 type:complete len:88 (+) Transcript_22771:610-873(+)
MMHETSAIELVQCKRHPDHRILMCQEGTPNSWMSPEFETKVRSGLDALQGAKMTLHLPHYNDSQPGSSGPRATQLIVAGSIFDPSWN